MTNILPKFSKIVEKKKSHKYFYEKTDLENNLNRL